MALFVEEVLVIVGVTVLCGDVEDMVWLRTEGLLLGEMLVRGVMKGYRDGVGVESLREC